MKLDEIIDKNYDCLTSTDQLIVQEIRRDKEEIKNLNSIQTAKRLGISRTSLVRLMKKLGISSYAEFKLILKQEKEDNSHSKIEMNTIIQDYHNMIEELKNYDYSTVCQQIYDAQTIYLYGSGNEQKAIIEEFKRIFLIMGKWCVDLFDYGEIEFAKKDFKENDVFIVVSLSGENEEVLRAMRLVLGTNIHTLSMTRWKNNSLARMTENNLYVGTKMIDQNKESSYEMIAAFYILLDILSVKYLATVKQNSGDDWNESR